MEKVGTLETFLFYIVCLFQFQKRFSANNEIYDILQKYDFLLEKPVYQSAFRLMDSSISETESDFERVIEAIIGEGNGSVKPDFMRDVRDIIKLLKMAFKLNGFSGGLVSNGQFENVGTLDDSAGPGNVSRLVGEAGECAELDNTSMMADKQAFEQIYQSTLDKNQKKLMFQKKINNIE